jgi:hypothetical protein
MERRNISYWEMKIFPLVNGKRFQLGRGNISHWEGERSPIGKWKLLPLGRGNNSLFIRSMSEALSETVGSLMNINKQAASACELFC